MERYQGVQGAARVERISSALQVCGAELLTPADPRSAPFEYRIRTPEGEVLDLVCYAFTANKYRQRRRPGDEHRFQVKYGSEFKRAHQIYVDPTRNKITLMFGVHEELDLFVAVDPMMHRVTWFSSSIEFKEDELLAAAKTGWHGWERERLAHGRRRADPRPEEDLRVESVLALRPDQFLRYVQFERVATGLDPGERLLFTDGWERKLAGASRQSAIQGATAALLVHPLERQLGLDTNEILEVIQGRARLLTAVLGGVAERHLEQYLVATPGITDVERLDVDGSPDFKVRYRNRKNPVRIECKNVRRQLARQGPWVDFQKTRAAKANPCSRYYSASQFEVLAACLHPITENWEFRFGATAELQPHKKCAGKLSERVVVEASWPKSLPELLERLAV